VENVFIIPHGAAIKRNVSKVEAKEKFDLKGKKVLGMLGWFNPTKGFHRVISMWDDLSSQLGDDTVLVLAGDARFGSPNQIDYKNKLLDLVNKCAAKDNVRLLLGSFTPREYEQILSSFDAMIMPYTFASQSGNLAHSFSLGVPVVVSGIEGLKAEVEASGAGIAVESDNDFELKRAIINIIKDDVLRSEYSERALNYVRSSIGWDIIVRKHMKIYRNVIIGKKDPYQSLRSKALLDLE
jgi:glycosyltransferase involved in cell wall biosynthesis